MSRAKLLQEVVDARVENVRSRVFCYRPKKPARRPWTGYNAAQENEFPEVIGLIGRMVGKASESFRPPRSSTPSGGSLTPSGTWLGSCSLSSTRGGATGSHSASSPCSGRSWGYRESSTRPTKRWKGATRTRTSSPSSTRLSSSPGSR